MPRGVYDRSHIAPWNRGLKGAVTVSEETRAKLREKRAGRKPNLGKRHSDETKRRMSEAQRAIGNTPPSHKGIVRSSEVRARMSVAQKRFGYMQSARGERCPNWKGGIVPENKKWRTSPEYKAWRVAVFTRDDWTCRECEGRGHLHSHHIKGFAAYPELRFVVGNGLTLCKPCHLALHGLIRKAA